jgi:hypothetical protein
VAAPAATAQPASLSAIVPLRITGRHYWDNALRVSFLLSSLARFAAPETFAAITVIVPADEFEAARPLPSLWPELPVRVAAESHLLPDVFAQKRYIGLRPWHFQQLIKLGACAAAETPLVMIFDPDVVATGPFAHADLVAGDRPVIHTEAKAVHRDWWQASADVLDLEIDWAGPGLSVTPQILRADLCRALLARIETIHRRPWPEVLRDLSCMLWTEYTLYGLFCESQGVFDNHHVVDAGRARSIMCRRNVWLAHEFDAAAVRGLFGGDDPGIFLVVQSASGIPAATLAEVFAGAFPLAACQPADAAAGAGAIMAARLADGISGALRKGIHALQRLRARRRGGRP